MAFLSCGEETCSDGFDHLGLGDKKDTDRKFIGDAIRKRGILLTLVGQVLVGRVCVTFWLRREIRLHL